MKEKDHEGPLPSEIEDEGKEWLLWGLKKSRERLDDYLEMNEVLDPESMDKDEFSFPEDDLKAKDIDRRAVEDGYLSGKWEFSIPPRKVDEVWREIKKLVSDYKIWGGQVTTKWIREKKDVDDHIIRVYTPNYLDEEDVLRVGNLLKERCGIEEEILYKPDIYNVLQVYSEEGEWKKLPKEIRYRL